MWTVCCLSQAFQEDVKRRYSVSSVVKLTEEKIEKVEYLSKPELRKNFTLHQLSGRSFSTISGSIFEMETEGEQNPRKT